MLTGKTIEKRYCIVREIGKGSFCNVYLARDLTTLKPVAVKVLKPGNPDAEFKREIEILSALKNAVGVPKYYGSGKEGLQQYIVMEMLESDVFKIVSQRPWLSLGLVLRIAYDTIRALESIHNSGYLHLDIKPDNIALRKKKGKYECYFLDFGLASKYVIHGTHYAYREEERIRGNPIFASRYMLMGVRPSRRDDLESLMYTLAFLANGNLPWMKSRKSSVGSIRQAVIESKDNYSPAFVIGRLPAELAQVLISVKDLRFEEKPDYARYVRLVEQAAGALGVDLAESEEWDDVLAESLTASSVSQSSRLLTSAKDLLQVSNNASFLAETPSINRRRAKRRLTKHMEQLDITPRRPNRTNVVICKDEFVSTEGLVSQKTISIAFTGRKERGKDGTIKTDVSVTPKLRSNLAQLRNLVDSKVDSSS